MTGSRTDLVALPEGYDPTDRATALKTLGETNGLVTGLIYQDTTKPSFEKLWLQQMVVHILVH